MKAAGRTIYLTAPSKKLCKRVEMFMRVSLSKASAVERAYSLFRVVKFTPGTLSTIFPVDKVS